MIRCNKNSHLWDHQYRTVLWNGSEGDNVVEIEPSERVVHVDKKHLTTYS